MTNVEKIQQMDVDDLAEWLCRQFWEDYGKDPLLSGIRFHHVRNFLLMEARR